jgi:hypothetical protein
MHSVESRVAPRLESINFGNALSSPWVGRRPMANSLAKGEPDRLPDLTGEAYRSCLARLHHLLRPRTYLEIGTFYGDSLKLARCAAIAVDPKFQLQHRIPNEFMPALCLFQMRSDEFFKSYDPRAILGGPIDFAFLDGMHLLECLVRDFIHTERACHSRSVVVLHDCIPIDLHMAGRAWGDMTRRALSVHPDWWTGDVWKILPVLRRYRPDLTVQVFNAPPTGLVVVRGLDPNSPVLAEHQEQIFEQFCKPKDESALFEEFLSDLEIHDTGRLSEMLYQLPVSEHISPSPGSRSGTAKDS